VIDEDPPHRPGGGRKEVPAAVELILPSDQLGPACFCRIDRSAFEAADQYLRAVFVVPDLS
jgi:hypothetical protein